MNIIIQIILGLGLFEIGRAIGEINMIKKLKRRRKCQLNNSKT
jgi:hypothetical protein